jgi:hypothetical protein
MHLHHSITHSTGGCDRNSRCGECRDSQCNAVEDSGVGDAAVYSVLVSPTRWILGSPSFHPMTKLAGESLIANELKIAPSE